MSDNYVTRAGDKLAAALLAFRVDVRGATCIDFGSHVGGFVDCLLRHGAARVHAVDPGYGILHPSLRDDPRVTLHERTNALDFRPPEPADLISIDVGWTPQRLILPAARRGLAPGGRVISLIKPHYEAPRHWLRGGVLVPERLPEICRTCRQDATELGWNIDAEIDSPILGQGGNRELLWLLTRPG